MKLADKRFKEPGGNIPCANPWHPVNCQLVGVWRAPFTAYFSPSVARNATCGTPE